MMLPRTHSPGWPTIDQQTHHTNISGNEKDDSGEKLVMPEIIGKSPMHKKELLSL